jgi:hypothetical protein
MGLYTIAKEARVGDTAGQQAAYHQLMADKPKKETRVAALEATKSREVLQGKLDAQKRQKTYERTKSCTDATRQDSRDFCANIDILTSQIAVAPKAADLARDLEEARAQLRSIETQLAGINLSDVFKKADAAGEALARSGFLGSTDVETVKFRLAVMLAILLECGGLLPWIVTGSHAPGRRHEPQLEPPPTHKPDAPVPEKPIEKPTEPAPLVPADEDGLVAQWARASVVRRKGASTPAGEMHADLQFWMRLYGHGDPPNKTAFGKEMTRFGFKRIKRSGAQLYVDIALMPRSRELKVVASNTA